MALQLRRGSNLQRLSITPQPGELIFTTDQKALWIGDGLTAGGINVLASAFPQGNPSGLEWNSSTNTVNFNINSFSALTTTNVPEGTNKYFTPTAMLTALNTAIAAGTQNGITFTIANGALSATVTGGGTTLPDKTGNSGKWLTLDNSGNLMWHTAPLGSGLSLPSMPGNQGSYLTTDGINLTWKDIAINSLSSGSYHLTLDESTGNLFLNQAYPGGAGSIMLPQGGDILKYNGTTYVSALNGLINSVQADTNPKLGANLDLNGHNIVGTTGAINITQSITAGTIVATTGLGANLPLNSYGITGSGTIGITGSITSYNSSATTASININGPIITVPASVLNNSIQLRNTGIRITADTTDHDSGISMTGITSGPVTNSQITLSSQRGTTGAPSVVQTGDLLSLINFSAFNGTNQILSSVAGVFVDPGPITANSVPTRFGIVTTNGVDTVTTRFINGHYFSYDSNGVLSIPHSTATGYNTVSSSTGAISTYTTFASLSGVSVTAAGTYTNLGQKSTSGIGGGAVFNVTKTGGGTSYNGVTTITMVNPGQGYVTGDTITISGSGLGGAGTTNDLTFTLATHIKTGIGYDTGAGGTATQLVNKAYTVVLNKSTGTITLNNALLASGTSVSFTFTNSTIGQYDMVMINHSVGGTLGAYGFTTTPFTGGCTVTVKNNTGGALSEAITLQFAVIKSAVA
jgi:hypothetical protein